MKVMSDVNVLLDYLQKREPHYAAAALVVKAVLKNAIAALLPAHGVTTVYYILAKHANRQKANAEMDWLLNASRLLRQIKQLFWQRGVQAWLISKMRLWRRWRKPRDVILLSRAMCRTSNTRRLPPSRRKHSSNSTYSKRKNRRYKETVRH